MIDDYVVEVKLADHVVQNIDAYIEAVASELSQRSTWQDPSYGQGFTPEERTHYYHAHRAGKWGRRFVGIARWLGIMHKQGKEGGRCPDCGKHYGHDYPYLAIRGGTSRLRVWQTWQTLCSAHLMGRLAMWHLLEIVKYGRRIERRHHEATRHNQ